MNFDQLATEMMAANTSVTRAKMFGMPTLMISGKGFAGLRGEDMVFKLTGGAHEKALELSGSHLFDPMGGRPMKEWVVVPASQSQAWHELAEAAKDYVNDLQGK